MWVTFPSSTDWENVPALMTVSSTCAVQYGSEQPHVNSEKLNFKSHLILMNSLSLNTTCG